MVGDIVIDLFEKYKMHSALPYNKLHIMVFITVILRDSNHTFREKELVQIKLKIIEFIHLKLFSP